VVSSGTNFVTDQLDTLQKIEIAEGAEIRLRVAGPAVRSLAFMVDTLVKSAITFAVAVVIFLITGAAIGGEDGNQIGQGFLLLALFLIEWGYFVWFEHSPKGATPGKRAFGLRVVRTSGAPISLTQAVIRNVLRFVDVLPFTYGIGLASCLMTKTFQRLGDLAAGTLVVYADPKPKERETSPEAVIRALHPPNPLSREEQGAIVAFADRIENWSEPRQEELANLAGALTQAEGRSSVEKLERIAQWVRTSG
tara:strand:+ start:7182 stop:7934 length:753 start_codon:yes stop_codon:yes gene_type:complete